MKKAMIFFQMSCLATFAFAGFKAKQLRPKKPEQYLARTTVGGVTYAADLLLQGKEQKDFFYKELTSSNIIAVRLAVFNQGKGDVILPVDGIQLIGPGGKELPLVAPDTVAQAVLQGSVVSADADKDKDQKDSAVRVGPNTRTMDPRTDRTDPRYDPRMDPNDPSYDPNDPRVRNDPRYNDPRYNDPRYGRYPMPGVNVMVNPTLGGGGGGGDRSAYEGQLIQKDFNDKAHSSDPIDPMMVRDRFLYFSMPDRPVTDKGFVLRIPAGKGIPQEIVLRF